MLNITNYWKNANQNCYEVPPCRTQNGHLQKKKIYIYILQAINARKSVEEREPSYTVDGDVNWYNPYAKQYGGSSKKLKIELPNCSLTHLLVISLYP